jgi:OmpA-OmpF porin, OOP family
MKTISAKIYLLGMLVLPAFISGNASAYEEHGEAGIATTHDHAEEGQASEISPGYVIDSSGKVVRNSDPDSLCWRTGHWEKEDATMECDPDLVPQPEQVVEAPAPVIAPPEKITFSADALFDFDSATLKPEGMQALDSFADQLASLNYDLIIAVGYADRIGNEDYNKKLSVRRAESVKEYLVTHKAIDQDRIFTDGKGEANPVTGDSCHDANKNALIECLAPDRRVEIEVAGTR